MVKRVLLVCCLVSTYNVLATPAQVIIVRHGEKISDATKTDDPSVSSLDARGFERAAALAPYFVNNFGAPDYVFAILPSRDYLSTRTIQTCAPTAQDATRVKATHKAPQMEGFVVAYAQHNTEKLAKDLLEKPEYDGKRVVICWSAGHINAIAQGLGVTEALPHWPDTVFDVTYVLDYENNKLKKFSRKPQNLLQGDHTEVPF